MLERYDNLWIDLSWVVFEDYIAPDGQPSAEWVPLANEIPTRFMIGSDKVAELGNLHKEVIKYYVSLDVLNPDRAQLVARDDFLGVLPIQIRDE